MVPPPKGPLRVACATKPSNKDRVFKVHLLNTEFVAVGCGWKPKSGAIQDLDERDYWDDALRHPLCARCFKVFSLPELGWLPVPQRPQAA